MKFFIFDNNLVIFLELKVFYGKKEEVNMDFDFYILFGKGDIKCEGIDLIIVFYGCMFECVM